MKKVLLTLLHFTFLYITSTAEEITHVCMGQTVSLICTGSLPTAITGGTWTTSNASVVTVNSSGTATGVSAGTAAVTYTPSVSCGNAMAIYNITVDALPSAITGPASVCQGNSINLLSSSPGGSWTSSTPAIGTINSVSGLTLGITTGTTTITYTLPSGCYVYVPITVNASPGIYTMTGGNGCTASGVSIGLNNSETGNSYQLYNSTSAVGSSIEGTGSAISFGTIHSPGTYIAMATNSLGCTATMASSSIIYSMPTQYTITGGTGCEAAGIYPGLSNSQTGVSYQLLINGTPSGSPMSGTGGAINFGLKNSVGTYTIVGTGPGGCVTEMAGNASVISVPSIPSISGNSAICRGSSITLTNPLVGGTWSSSNTSQASISSSGTNSTGEAFAVVNGVNIVSAVNINYSVSNACGTSVVTKTVQIKSPPSLTGGATMCLTSGTTISITANPAGGTFSCPTCDNTSYSVSGNIATITATSTGSDLYYYTWSGTSSSYCEGTAVRGISVLNSVPNTSISGPNTVATNSMTNYTGGISGTWSYATSISATISPSTGGSITLYSGTAPGAITITLTSTNACGTTSTGKTISVGAGKMSNPGNRDVKTVDINQGSNIQVDINTESSSLQFDTDLQNIDINDGDFYISPNPTRGIITIRTKQPIRKKVPHLIIISTSEGKEIIRKTTTDESIQIDLSNYPSGSYLVSAYMNETKSTKILVIQ